MTRKGTVICVGVVLVLWFVVGVAVPGCWFSGNDQRGMRGTWGDQFGGVNSLFTGLAFAGVLISLYIQNEELTHAREEQRRAASQQTKAITAQLFLQVTDEIRSVEWGKAHDHLWLYYNSSRTGFHKEFARRRDSALGREHDMNRRVFLEPCYKVWNLVKAELVDDAAARVVLGPDIVLTLLEVIEPLEEIIRTNYDRSMFNWARALYSQPELQSLGTHLHATNAAVPLSTTGG